MAIHFYKISHDKISSEQQIHILKCFLVNFFHSSEILCQSSMGNYSCHKLMNREI